MREGKPLKEIKVKMEDSLMKLLVFVNIVQFINTVLNVIHKLKKIPDANAHIAMAILSIIVLMGYSGVLNTIFLHRNFSFGRIFYMALAILSQIVILILSILSFVNIMTYFDAIAVIHGLVGFITIINFTAAVLVVDEQQKEMRTEEYQKQNEVMKERIKVLEKLTRRASIVPLHVGRTTYSRTSVRASMKYQDSELLEMHLGGRHESFRD